MDIPNVFRFVATFADGSQLTQNEEDKSSLTPDKNCYYDVLQRNDCISFVLINGDMVFGVDLRDGHFEVNGVPFFQHHPDLVRLKNFRPFYSRTVDRKKDFETGREWSDLVGYTIGFDADVVSGAPDETVSHRLNIRLNAT